MFWEGEIGDLEYGGIRFRGSLLRTREVTFKGSDRTSLRSKTGLCDEGVLEEVYHRQTRRCWVSDLIPSEGKRSNYEGPVKRR